MPHHATLGTSEQQVCTVFFAGRATAVKTDECISYVVAGSQTVDQRVTPHSRPTGVDASGKPEGRPAHHSPVFRLI